MPGSRTSATPSPAPPLRQAATAYATRPKVSEAAVNVTGMTNSGIILAVGIGCALACAALCWLLLSKTLIDRRLRRIGIDPNSPLDSDAMTDEQYDAMWRYSTAGPGLGVVMAIFGVAAIFLITFVWSDFPYVVMAACVGWIAWMLNERRKGARAR